MLNFNGDTAVYLLYGHARIASILKKAETTKGVSIESLRHKERVHVSQCLNFGLVFYINPVLMLTANFSVI